ncbi:MAG: 3-beta hydroxysteroid dehydrogenase [Cellvibrionaceae bacterium]|nr:3-beta hydroxysteroid dehydrogenase [Cellvibrionaceae bacterium]|tara:strand:+ start:7915 stop:8688 length:774 start_codon:yes stop_codon:yes gene_type:complete
MKLQNKVAVITGGGTGIGRATALLFAEQGARVVVTGIEAAPLHEVVIEIKQLGGEALAIEQDVTLESTWDSVIAEVIGAYGQLDILINNAGIALFANTEDESLENWEKTQSVNLNSVFLGTRAAIKAMKESGGSIVNVSSIEGLVGHPMASAYNASKGGVRIYSKSAALHCAQQGYNIRINTLHPGFISTPMTTTNVVESFGEEGADAFLADVISKIPMGRMAEAREMATGLLFLASDDSTYMTGAELVMDGGFTAQ